MLGRFLTGLVYPNLGKVLGATPGAILGIQKNPRVRKMFVRHSGAGNGCAHFMDAWKNASVLQENRHVHKIPRFTGGGVFWVLGGGKCRFYFYGRADFSD